VQCNKEINVFISNVYLPVIEVENVRAFLTGLREYINTSKPNFKQIIDTTKTFTSEAENLLKSSILEYKKLFSNKNA
jgi:F-type H+-transporting ATPase subunit alpha